MKEFIEKLIGRLEEEKNVANNTYMNYELNVDLGRVLGLDEAIENVNQLAEEYVPDTNVGKKDKWIPVEERLPERKEKKKQFGNKQKRTNVLVTLRNGIVKEMMYEFETKEFWEPGDENPIEHWKEDVADSDFDVIAWQPLPEPYKEKGE